MSDITVHGWKTVGFSTTEAETLASKYPEVDPRFDLKGIMQEYLDGGTTTPEKDPSS